MIKQGNEQQTARRHRATKSSADRTAGGYRPSSEITSYAREIDSLRALVAKLQRMLFGRSSEKKREKIEKKIAQAEKRITEFQNRLGEA